MQGCILPKAVLIAATLALPCVAQAATVVVNGTFDDRTSGWTGTWGIRDDGRIDTGPYYSAGTADNLSITQVYSLTASELTDLAAGGLGFVMSADLFGFRAHRDSSTFSVSFRDSASNVLATQSLTSLTLEPIIWPDSLVAGNAPNFQSVTGSVPVDTASLLFTVSSNRQTGINNDGYVDNAFFELTGGTDAPPPPPPTVPLPASIWLMIGALGGLGAATRRWRQS